MHSACTDHLSKYQLACDVAIPVCNDARHADFCDFFLHILFDCCSVDHADTCAL